MSSSRKLFFTEDRPPERLDTFLAECFPEISRSQIKKLIDTELVSLDGTPAKASRKLKGGESVLVILPEPEPSEARAEDIPLHILYEDHDLIVIDKPAGMVVHPAAGHSGGTLVNALLHHCQDLAGIGGELRPGIVHRLDKDTSGVMVATKNDRSHLHLAAQFKKHSINRRYLALVHGCPETTTGKVDKPIGRHPVQRKKMSSKARNGRRAVTHWSVLKDYRDDRLSLIEFTLETGRTHQIRVHFSELGFPLVADPLYGRRGKEFPRNQELSRLVAKLPGQALHARLLGFIHPSTGKYLEFSSEIPDTLNEIISYLDLKNALA
ncbi:RluA family pseudouridine synthase [Pelobacter seleniigenes]|uniref:RluA family pseudouridine synthase n=1 Tax=Pelobacter seleniigenes TaxID=407188 RepID=UPI0004A6CA56|nr:RluA family pseudouridine synthase [Pelobacter seleniigenes]